MEKKDINYVSVLIFIVIIVGLVGAYLVFKQTLDAQRNELNNINQQLFEMNKGLTASQEESRRILKEKQNELEKVKNEFAAYQQESSETLKTKQKQLEDIQHQLQEVEKNLAIPQANK